jgi:NADPH:quinone reductase-like Zn-dependent oxidoreductase
MKAVQVIGYGNVDQLKYVECEIPTPKAHEALIQVKACAINNTEIWMREGAYGDEQASGWRPEGVVFPRIPGSDIAGTVVSVGSSVRSSLIGQNVVLFPFISSKDDGNENISDDVAFIGSEYDGGYAQYVVWPAQYCFEMPLPSFINSCVFSVSGLTAWHMCEQVSIQPNQVVVVSGASGGVGLFNVQIASKVFHGKVIAIVGDLRLEAQLKNLGATHVLSYRSSTLLEDIQTASGGHVDVVLDVVGDALFSILLNALKVGGKYCISGSIGGQKTQLDLRVLYLKHITLYGSVLGSVSEYKKMLKAISNGLILPIIDKTFDLAQAKEAQLYFKKPGKFGKVVLLID